MLLDLIMPGMPGETALKEIQQIRPEVPVILLTGLAEQAAKESVAGLPVAGYLMKPVSGDTLTAMVRAAIGSS